VPTDSPCLLGLVSMVVIRILDSHAPVSFQRSQAGLSRRRSRVADAFARSASAKLATNAVAALVYVRVGL